MPSDKDINETEICKDCLGSGCVDLRPCVYCNGTGNVLTYRARMARKEADAPRYTQAQFDAAIARQELFERERLLYWLLRCYQSGHREGWEDGPSVAETMEGVHSILCNEGYDPAQPQAAALLARKF